MKLLCLPFNFASKHTSAPTPPPPTKSHQNLTHSQPDTVSSTPGMATDSQSSREYSADERAKNTPPPEYSERPGDSSTHKCNDLAEWFQHVSTCYLFTCHGPNISTFGESIPVRDVDKSIIFFQTPASVTGEREGTKMVRTFYTSRKTPKGDINVWYADGEFGFYESVPKRIADLCATHVLVEVRNLNP